MDNNNQSDNPQMNNTPYGNPQMNNTPYGNPQMNNTPYGDPQMNNAPYGNPQMNNTPYGNQQVNNASYGNPQMNNVPYGNPQMNNMQYGGMQMGTPQYGNSPKKKGPGILILCICIGVALIAGIVMAIIIRSNNKDDDSNQGTEHTVSETSTEITEGTTEVAEVTEDTTEVTEDTTEVTEDTTEVTEDTETEESTDEEDTSGATNNNGDYDKEGYVEVLDAYFECYSNKDMEGMASYYPADIGTQVWDATIEAMGVNSPEGYWALLSVAYGEDFTITYEITDTAPVQQVEYTLYEANILATYGVDLDFEYAITMTIDEFCEGSLNSTTATESLLMAVVDGEWYVIGSIYY